MSSNENNKTKKRAKGPKYHKWNPNKNAYFLLKPYQLLKDPDVEKGRLMPLGMRELLTDEQFEEYSDYAPIKIVDDKHKEKKNITKKIKLIKPTEAIVPTVQQPTVNVLKRKPKLVIIDNVPEQEKLADEEEPVVEKLADDEELVVEKLADDEEPVVEKLADDEEPVVEKLDENQLDTDNDNYGFLYPELDDPEFNIKIAQRKEFYDTQYDGNIYDIKKQADILCNADFELMPHQLFVKNFLSFQTPYNSLLLYHGLGTGKTCTAIGVAEEMRNYMKQVGMRKSIMIIASPNVQDNFRLQLFDERKLKQENGVWNIQSCVGSALLNEINPTAIKDIPREKIISQIKTLIKTYYVFMGYTKFANYISDSIEVKGIRYSTEERNKMKIQKIKNVFNNRLIIIDEVHNIRITNENKEKRKSAELLMDVAKYSENMRLLLLSATPMYNSYEEIIWLTNLMNLNDKRSVIKISDIFDKNGNFKEDGEETGKELLRRKLTGYVSYIRGENPYTFPYRVYPELPNNFVYPSIQMNRKTIEEDKQLKHVPVYLNSIGEYQRIGYEFIINNMRKRSYDTFNKFGTERDMPAFEEMDSFGYTLLQTPIESLNIVYPNEDFLPNSTYEIEEDEIISNMTGIRGLSRIMSYKEETKSDNPQRYNFQYRNDTYGRIFTPKELPKYSAKIANICDIIRNSEGIILIYSQYIDGGLVPVALALEEMGFTRFGTEKYTKPLLKNPAEPIDSITMLPKTETAGEFNQAKYVMITGDKTFSPNNDADIKYINNIENKNGKNVKVVLISKAAGEGVDLKNIRQVHVLEPWYNMNRIEQIIGRGVRNLSHCGLPFEKRNVEIFLHATRLDNNEESADLYVYRLAEQKSIKIGKVSRVLKETAADCILNIGQTNFTNDKLLSVMENQNIVLQLSSGKTIDFKIGDKPYSDICDYMENCNFQCSPMKNIEDIDITYATYNNDFVKMNNDRIIQRIRDLFKDIPGRGRYFYKRDELINSINVIKKYPLEQIYYALTYLIENKSEYLIDKYGRLGNLINKDEYYIFQPLEITDEDASLYDRMRPVDVKHQYVHIELPKKQDTKVDNEEPQDTVKNIENFDTIMVKLDNNFNTAVNIENITTGEKDWYKNFAVIALHLENKHNIKKDKQIEHLVHHIMDEIPFNEKIIVLEHISSNGWSPNNKLQVLIKEYFDDKIITADNGDIGVPLSSDHKTTKIYIQDEDNKNKWKEAEFVASKNIITSTNYIKKNIFNKNTLNDIIGFMEWTENQQEYVFKIRDLSDSVNKKGARVNQAQIKDIITKLNTVLGEQMYDMDNIKDYIGEGKHKLVVLIEIIIREMQSKKQDNKTWFLSNEQMIINEISKYTR